MDFPMTDFYLNGPDYDFNALIASLPTGKVRALDSAWPPLVVKKIVQQGQTFSAHVHNQRNSWTVLFSLRPNLGAYDYFHPGILNAECDCGHPHCVHFVAALSALRARQGYVPASSKAAPLTLTDQFIGSLTTQPAHPARGPAETTTPSDRERLFYLDHDRVTLMTTRRLKNGNLSVTRKLEGSWAGALGLKRGYGNAPADTWYYKPDELRAIKQLWLDGVALPEDAFLRLHAIKDASAFFHALARTEKLFSDHFPGRPIQIGPEATLELEWELVGSKVEPECRLTASVAQFPGARLLRTNPPWYHDVNACLIGPVNTDLPHALIAIIHDQRKFPVEEAEKVAQHLDKLNFSKYLPPLPTIKTIDVIGLVPEPIFVLHFNSTLNWSLWGDVQMKYQEHEISLSSLQCFIVPGDPRQRIHRNTEFETAALKRLRDALQREINVDGSVHLASGYGYENEITADLLSVQEHFLPAIERAGWSVRFSESIPAKLATVAAWDLHFSADKSDAWYAVSLEVNIDGCAFNLIDVLKSLLSEPKFVNQLKTEDCDTDRLWYSRIAQDRYVAVPVAKVKRLARYLLELTSKERSEDTLRISRFDLSLLEFSDENSGYRLHGTKEIEALRQKLAAPIVPVEARDLPDANITLRDYQGYGVGWLKSRQSAGVGAILGDDMGIGKTAQVLSHIWSEHAAAPALPPSLIIVPPTLISQWGIESARFFPRLRLGVYHGTDRRALEDLREECHAIITSYQTLALKIDAFLPHPWHIVAMDEGHDLRNPKAAKTKACRALEANQKVVVTGTVLQNRPEDLWSIMDIIVPGLLGDHKRFRSVFLSKARGEDPFVTERLALLGKITAPYHLHRSNKDVGNALPSVNTVLRYVDMGQEQRSLYETTRAVLDEDVRQKIAETGLAKNHITVLSAITRLRQICNHPALVKSEAIGSAPSAAKLDMLCDMAADLTSELGSDGVTGKKLVVTSEWAGMLDLVEQALEPITTTVSRLDGRMTPRARTASLKAFRQGQNNVLLMTLGVGGVGLDIPEAEAIIVLAPWWNPKRIDQAIARLTRDDRHESITAYILVMKDSLEEGVLEIGERKRAMIQTVLDGGDSDETGALTEEDLALLFQPRG